jgi:acyl-CoA synthetase (AMP-forming)/AMP-acid ligase II
LDQQLARILAKENVAKSAAADQSERDGDGKGDGGGASDVAGSAGPAASAAEPRPGAPVLGIHVAVARQPAELQDLQSLQLIERHRITHSQWVPTMFVRMLKLPEDVRARYDMSSMRVAVHAAAPCPVDVKQRMLDWWGPIVHEYYAGTENNGFCAITPHEWVQHKGSVGRAAQGVLHICDEAGNELPVGGTGLVYFSDGPEFEYHNDPVRTAQARNVKGWSTLGDIGRLDGEGYLYLVDRRAFMIISGGVNIYPQEAESILISHPKVADVAVIGVPSDDLGEEVKAVVQLLDPDEAGPAMEAELLSYCRQRLASFKCPRSVDFDAALPRQPTGKLHKQLVRGRYWPA